MTEENKASESSEPTPLARKPRRWLQFGLRGPLILTALVSALAGWVAIQVNRAKREAAAIAELKNDHGNSLNLTFINPYEPDEPGDMEMLFEGGPEWMKDLLGVDLFRSVSVMICYAPGNSFRYESDDEGQLVIRRDYKRGVTDEQMAAVGRMTNLKFLQIEGSPLGNEGVRHLANLKKLEQLNLCLTTIDDEALETIARLPNLRSLNISRTVVTDRGLKTLSECKRLNDLNVKLTRVTAAGIAEFQAKRPECLVESNTE